MRYLWIPINYVAAFDGFSFFIENIMKTKRVQRQQQPFGRKFHCYPGAHVRLHARHFFVSPSRGCFGRDFRRFVWENLHGFAYGFWDVGNAGGFSRRKRLENRRRRSTSSKRKRKTGSFQRRSLFPEPPPNRNKKTLSEFPSSDDRRRRRRPCRARRAAGAVRSRAAAASRSFTRY